VCEDGLEGFVCKRLDGCYPPGERGWVKVKNPGYWRRESKLAVFAASR
jgi:ATP-dependent DNA ligase